MSTRISTVIFCDDIIKELSGKEILIGVYSGNIQVNSYPAQLRLSLWIEFEADAPDQGHWELQVATPSGNPPIQVDFDMEVKSAGSSSMSMVGLPVRLESDGEIAVSSRRDTGDWRIVKRKPVLRVAPSN